MKIFFNKLIFWGILMTTSLGNAAVNTIFFKSKLDLENVLSPLNLEEVIERIATSNASTKIRFQYDANLTLSKITPLRHPSIGNLLNTELYKTKVLTVYYPEKPRVPHHLTIVLNRKEIKSIADVNEGENTELFTTIKKIAEIYNSISIQGFVIAQFDTPQEGHSNRYVVEIIPYLPGFKGVKNIVDKMDCNRYVLFRNANLSSMKYTVPTQDINAHIEFWRSAFTQKHAPIAEDDTKISFPAVRKESHHLEAEKILYNQLVEILEDKGGQIESPIPCEFIMPTIVPETVKSVEVEKCAFCDQSVIDRQLVYEYEDVLIFYNIRKGAKPGSCFLILPKRHTEKVYGLTSSEIQHLYIVRRALVAVLKETYPECEIVVYTQDDPAVGQTVFHSHEQVVAIDPNTIALTWTLLSLYPSGNVSDKEMLKIRKEFGLKLGQKIEELTPLADVI